ncbi:MAG: DUF6125 family protein [Dehalococcoidia bacterium]|nr:DUF6125 family protein [Dehalococcoidia bacterium]
MPVGEEELKSLSKEKLIEVIKMFSRNWNTLDGLWFLAVEEEFGFEAAASLDEKVWEIEPVIEAKRIKALLDLSGGGPDSVVRAIDFMTWAPSFEYTWEKRPGKIIWTCTKCPPQEARKRKGLPENTCKPMGINCFDGLVKVIDPSVKVNCLVCPPDPHKDNLWCQWEFIG